MKKAGSTTAKVGAWIGLTICAFVFWCGLGALAVLDEMDAYTLSESELTDQLYHDAIERYSLEAVGLTYQGKDAVARFSDTYYRFGIIEADDISDVDLRDKKSYDVENFGDALDDDAELNVISYGNISSQTSFWYADNLFDDYGYGDTVYAYGESYYYSFSGVATETTTVASTSEEDGTADIAEESGDTKKNGTSKGKTYKVVSVIPQNVTDTGLFSDDMFVQAHTLVVWAYRLRYSVFLILLAVFLIAIWLFVFLMCSAGHRKNQEGIVLTLADKISTDVFVVAVIALEFMLFLAMYSIISVQPHPSWPILLAALAAVAYLMCYLALFALLSIAVRVKNGTIWKNSWIYRIGRQIGRGCGVLADHMSLLWKALVLLGIYAVAEWFIIVSTYGYMGSVVMLLLFLKNLALLAGIVWCVQQMDCLRKGGERLAAGDLQYQVDTSRLYLEFREHGENLNRIGEGIAAAVDERMKSERFKTELITNVSHDIKTPLTSIINYVDLLEKEELSNATAEEYLEVLERQSGRLKKLIEDLIEASKASSGSLPVHMEKLEAGVFLVQTVGEFEEKTKAQGLELIIQKPEEPVYVKVDGRHLWRVIDNLMNNICKYAQPDTRVYIDIVAEEQAGQVEIVFRNTSKYQLHVSGAELMERFVRGDSSRNTEGNGLGLSIAQSLTELMGGTFSIHVDGDLFKVILRFAIAQPE